MPILPRGAGTSQCGQTVGAALVIDNSKYLNQVVAVDAERAVAEVQPGVVLDQLNAKLRAHGLWYPVDVSTSAQATLGGMAGNNSCGSRSIRYGNMVHNVLGIEAWLPSGEAFWFESSENVQSGPASYRALVEKIHAIAQREAAEIEARWPKVLRRVQGYNLDMVLPRQPHNLAHLLVGSEGTLAYFKRLRLQLSPLPRQKVLGVCHFPSFYQAMDLTRHIVALDPDAVELVDRTMIELAHSIPQYRDVLARFVRGSPDAILLVEFAGDDREAQLGKLRRLVELMGDLGLPGSVVEVTDAAVAEGHLGGAQSRPQHHDVHEGRRQTRVLHRGLRRAARASGRVHAPRQRDLRQARHAWHLVRACVGGNTARAAGAQHEGRRRAPDARDRRGDLRTGQALQGRLLRRARRRPGALGVDRADPGRQAHARARGDQGSVRPAGPDEPGQDRASEQDGRPQSVPLQARVCDAAAGHGAGLERVGWAARGRGDVQQQRPLPQVRRRHHVPVVSGHARRAAPHARARQYAAPGPVGAARTGCPGFRCDAVYDGLVRGLQGLQARVSDGCRHGAAQDRVPASVSPPARLPAAGQARRLPAPVRAAGRPARAIAQSAQPHSAAGEAVAEVARVECEALAAGVACG